MDQKTGYTQQVFVQISTQSNGKKYKTLMQKQDNYGVKNIMFVNTNPMEHSLKKKMILNAIKTQKL